MEECWTDHQQAVNSRIVNSVRLKHACFLSWNVDEKVYMLHCQSFFSLFLLFARASFSPLLLSIHYFFTLLQAQTYGRMQLTQVCMNEKTDVTDLRRQIQQTISRATMIRTNITKPTAIPATAPVSTNNRHMFETTASCQCCHCDILFYF